MKKKKEKSFKSNTRINEKYTYNWISKSSIFKKFVNLNLFFMWNTLFRIRFGIVNSLKVKDKFGVWEIVEGEREKEREGERERDKEKGRERERKRGREKYGTSSIT